MSKKDDTIYIRHIYDAITRIEDYTRGVDQEKFFHEHMIQDAVVRQLEIVGEAAAHISGTYKKAHSTIPWHNVVGMRNRLIHEYFGIDLKGIWSTVLRDLPPLKKELRDVLSQLTGQLGISS